MITFSSSKLTIPNTVTVKLEDLLIQVHEAGIRNEPFQYKINKLSIEVTIGNLTLIAYRS